MERYIAATANAAPELAAAEIRRLRSKLHDIGELLYTLGCDCTCGCDIEGHVAECEYVAECEQCLACRVGKVLGKEDFNACRE